MTVIPLKISSTGTSKVCLDLPWLTHLPGGLGERGGRQVQRQWQGAQVRHGCRGVRCERWDDGGHAVGGWQGGLVVRRRARHPGSLQLLHARCVSMPGQLLCLSKTVAYRGRLKRRLASLISCDCAGIRCVHSRLCFLRHRDTHASAPSQSAPCMLSTPDLAAILMAWNYSAFAIPGMLWLGLVSHNRMHT